jgi:protoporphyrinogen IX oxidase
MPRLQHSCRTRAYPTATLFPTVIVSSFPTTRSPLESRAMSDALQPFYLWIKAFHVTFVVAYFAALFYLPRLFVYHVDASDQVSHDRFVIMERRLYGLSHVAAGLAVLFGVLLVITSPALLQMHWLHAKLTLVALLIVYQAWCKKLLVAFREKRNVKSAKWFRLFNEVPALLLIGIAILAVVKPI